MKNLLFILLGLIPFVAEAGPGLYPGNDPKIPEQVRGLSASVYRLVMLSIDKPTVVKSEEYAAQIPKWAQGDFVQKLAAKELEACSRNGRKTCEIPYVGMGSAFLADNQDTLWTVRHNFEYAIDPFRASLPSQLDDQAKYRRTLDIALSFLVYDSKDRLVYDTRKPGDSARLTFYGDLHRIKFLPVLSDVAKIKLSRKLAGIPMQFSEQKVNTGETVFILGFPTTSKDRFSKYKCPDSDGTSFRISFGPTLDASKGYLAADNQLSPSKAATLDELFLFFDADGIPGQSGGPIVDKDGRVVSIFSKHYSAAGASGPEEDFSSWGGIGIRKSTLDQLVSEYQ